jgi:hypothetical protein
MCGALAVEAQTYNGRVLHQSASAKRCGWSFAHDRAPAALPYAPNLLVSFVCFCDRSVATSADTFT